VTFDASRRHAARRSSSSASLSSEEEDEVRSILGREEARVVRVGREGFSFLGSVAGFDEDEDFLGGAAGFGSGAFLEKSPPEGAAALGVGGVFGREDFFDSRSLSLDLDDFFSCFSDFSDLSLDDFSGFSDFDGLSDFDNFSGFDEVGGLGFDGAAAFNAAAALAVLVVFAGVVLVFAGGDDLALNCSNGLGHEPTGFGVSSTFAAASFFACAAALAPFTGVFGSGVAFVAAAAFGGGAPFLPVATGGGGGPSAGNAVSPKSCRARSFTLGNIVCEKPGYGDSGRLMLANTESAERAITITRYYKYNRQSSTVLCENEAM
jgi:hypothetical protein